MKAIFYCLFWSQLIKHLNLPALCHGSYRLSMESQPNARLHHLAIKLGFYISLPPWMWIISLWGGEVNSKWNRNSQLYVNLVLNPAPETFVENAWNSKKYGYIVSERLKTSTICWLWRNEKPKTKRKLQWLIDMFKLTKEPWTFHPSESTFKSDSNQCNTNHNLRQRAPEQ